MTRRVDIIGGGPGGALAARLLALRHPDWRVRLFERLPPDDTFGFGVGLTHGLVSSLGAADPEVLERVTAEVFSFQGASFDLPQGPVQFGQFHSGALRRSKLLRILLDSAVEAGAEVVIGRSVSVDELVDDADLVIAADGLSSATRTRFADALEPHTHVGRGAFIWCGGEVELDGTVFMPVETPAGTFVAHAYSYDRGLAALVIEASQETLERAGFTDRTWTSEGESDVEALEYLSDAFAPLLKGGKLFGNRSRWGHFTTLKCARWYHDNVVLLGDAVATAHPSLGSGTKLALESAIALADAIDAGGDEPLVQALPRYEAARRPKIERLQEAAMRSQLWWESFTIRSDLSPSRLAVAYLSRAGVVSLADLTTMAPELARQAAAEFAGVDFDVVALDELVSWVLAKPLHTDHTQFPSRIVSNSVGTVATVDIRSGDAWSAEAAQYLQLAHGKVGSGADVLRLVGGHTRPEVLDRLAVAERMRHELAVPIGVEVPDRDFDLAAAGLIAGRIDLVWIAS
ncbi:MULTISPECIES: FAD-dependent monooxygenase [unclassified Mycobacterium]|uniref:FAD-dependent monooxygenase n=1 Tax=unclassified Mycobacterium TaxID=2642494 RepID=UPI0029C80C52|nr:MULTISPECIES: FAD-dependent monooxygenase [unclassified Mycobacterium]